MAANKLPKVFKLRKHKYTQRSWARVCLGFSLWVGVAVFPQETSAASALSGYRWGYSVGYGGAGIANTQVLTNGTKGEVSRNEGPMVLSLFIDTLVSDTSGVSFEHSRGVNFLPYASGVSFTGFVYRWYFFGIAPSMVAVEGASTFLLKRFVPYLGFAGGFASATVQRDSTDLAPMVSGNGIYFGARIGADYPVALGRGIRPEFLYNTTAYSGMFSSSTSSTKPAALDEFALQCAWYYEF